MDHTWYSRIAYAVTYAITRAIIDARADYSLINREEVTPETVIRTNRAVDAVRELRKAQGDTEPQSSTPDQS